ncbi:hypothetical protein EI28_10710 [Methanoculleus sp. MH98A]|nr:hypothetical protein EI28_10710 [Methanoculleus sp. MH98A]
MLDPAPGTDECRLPDRPHRVAAGVTLVAGVGKCPVDGDRQIGVHPDEARPVPEVADVRFPWLPGGVADLEPLPRREQQAFSRPAAAFGKCCRKDRFQPPWRDDERVHVRPVAGGEVAVSGKTGIEHCVRFIVPGGVVFRRRDPVECLDLGIEGGALPREDSGTGFERPDHLPQVGVAHASGTFQTVGVDPVQGGKEVCGVPGDAIRRDRDHERLVPHRRRAEIGIHEHRIVCPEPERAFDVKPRHGVHIPGLGGVLPGVG